MGDMKTHIDSIRVHYEKNKDFYKTNQPILITLGVMIMGFFIAKMWNMKHGIILFMVALFIVAAQLKSSKKKSNVILSTTKKT